MPYFLGCDLSYQTIAFPIHIFSDLLDYGPSLSHRRRIVASVLSLFTLLFHLTTKKQFHSLLARLMRVCSSSVVHFVKNFPYLRYSLNSFFQTSVG
jgi:hypothetical protein